MITKKLKTKKLGNVVVIYDNGNIQLHIPENMDSERLRNWWNKYDKKLNEFKLEQKD